ncbi:MAG TPA: Ig-like domain repeat protein, partial [Symbiobacteriaceae bacterium]|nr:Ig-like domain repeat protein [Symbiobacteriaceae bacterium]
MKNLLRLLVVTLCSLVFIALVPIGSASALVVESIMYKDGDAKLYRISPDGTGKAQLLAVLGSQPARAVPSRDGTRLLAVPSSTQMVRYKTDGSEPTNIAASGYQYSTTFFAFSPSGTQVAFSGKATGDLRNNVYVQNADGTGTPFKVTSGSTNLAVADWGSGGILYRGGGGTVTGATPLWLVPPVASSTGTIITPTNFNALDARFSPDGTRIAMAGQNINATTGAGEGYGLFMVNPDGTAFGRLVALPNDVRPNSVAWSPDGTRVAVTAVTTADAVYRIYIVDIATQNTTLVTTGTGATPPNYIYWGPVEDPALPTVISTVDVTGQYSDTVTLTATLRYQATGLPVVGKTIHFKVNGVDFATTGTTDGTGTAGVSYPIDFQSGFYSIEAYFTGDATTSPASTAPGNNRTLTVNREGASLTYNGPTTTAGGTLALSATLAETSDVTPGVLTQAGSVQFTVRTVVGNTLVGTYTVPVPANGIVSATTGVLANEPHTVDVSLLSNLYYSASSVNLVVKATPTLAGNSVSGQYGDTVALKATMTPAVSGLPVRFSIGGTTLGTVATDAMGVATLNYPIGVAEGNHTVDLTFAGNTNYVGATATANLSVAKRPVTLAYTGDTVAVGGAFQLKAAVTPTSPGNIALAGPVTFTVTQGATSTTHTAPVDSAGVAVVNLAALPANTYTVAVSINSSYYEATPATATVRAGTVMTVDDLPATYGDTVTLRARLTMGGAGLGGQTVTFKLGSTDLGPALTDGSGYATVTYPVTVGAGPHTITVDFPDGGAYAGSDDTGTLTVSRALGTLSYSGDLVATGGAFNLEGTLAVTQGTVTNAGSLQFVVKQGAGTIGTYTDAVDAAGLAQTTIPTLPVGAYTVTVSLPLNPYYTADPINVIIRSGTTLTVPLVNATYGGTANVAAILKAGAVGVSGEPIDFTVNSVDAGTANTVGTGTATVAYPVTMPAGDYTIYAEYDGDAMYGPSNNTGTLRVTQAPATLSYAGDDVATGGAFALNGHLTPSQGALPAANTMQIKFDFMQGATVMHTYTLNIDGAGNAVGAAAPPPVAGAYTLKVSLLNNS